MPSPNHTYLELALIQENLDVALQNSSAQLTVFAPDDNAFTNLAVSLWFNSSRFTGVTKFDGHTYIPCSWNKCFCIGN